MPHGITPSHLGLGNLFKNPMFLPTEANKVAVRELKAARAANAAANKAAANAKAAANKARINAKAAANKARINAANQARAQANAKAKLNAALAARKKLEQNAAKVAANASMEALSRRIKANSRYSVSNALPRLSSQPVISRNHGFYVHLLTPPYRNNNSAWNPKGRRNTSNMRTKLEAARKNYKNNTKKLSTLAQFKRNYEAWLTDAILANRKQKYKQYEEFMRNIRK